MPEDNTIELKETLERQKQFFFTHQTKDVSFRIEKLKILKTAILAYEEKLYEALWEDLHKSRFEAYASEIGIVLSEIRIHLKNLKRWAKPTRVATNQLVHFWSTSRIVREPLGSVLIIAPWNYPFQLLINPLVGAISAGNCAVLKPSQYTPRTAEVLVEMVKEYFSTDYIAIFQGGRMANQALLEQKWDFIFFTGSPDIGKVVMEAAAKHLTPFSLELGGKSPCIVDEDANIKVAAARIVWGKFINAGQTCIAPDYIFVHSSVKTKFLELMTDNITRYFGDYPERSKDFGRIATVPKTERLAKFLENVKPYAGGEFNIAERYIAPTILDNPGFDHPLMQEEIFGPILPVFEFTDLSEPINYVNSHPKPLAFYYFSENVAKQKEILKKTSSGGGCINDVLMHIANDKLPFGGVGNSGTGRYHGKFSFDTFSNHRSILKKATFYDAPVRYAPYRKKWSLVKKLIR
ncbi:MAG: aldehyde dehydrogenase [Bacteroidetes bacterium]|nr:aldehyde dehydrogenase [Bacteroidota bacterium]